MIERTTALPVIPPDSPTVAALAGPAIRVAVAADVARLEALIVQSATLLSRGYYSAEQTAAAIAHVFGVDSQLVEDRSYVVAEANGVLAGCGGWSRRDKLFGGDRYGTDDGAGNGALDPATMPAKIRAFFVDPAFARRGIGTAILDACEADARRHGFTRGELLATLPGVPFYAVRGYVAQPPVRHMLGGIGVDFVPMMKTFDAIPPVAASEPTPGHTATGRR